MHLSGNPYDYREVSKVLLEVTGRMGNNPFYYPPWFAWIFLLLVRFDFQVARAIWLAVNFILWNCGLWRLNIALGGTLKGWRLYGLFALATFSFAWITWRYEQAGILLFVVLVELILSIRNRNYTWAGVWLALLLIKPNIGLPIAFGVGWWLIRNGMRRTPFIAVVAILSLTVVSTIVTPDWYQPFFEKGFGNGLTTVLDGPDKVTALRINSTFPDWLATFGLSRPFRIGSYALCAIFGAVILVRSVRESQSLLQIVSLSTLLSFALAPYALQYDFPPLVVTMFWSLSVALSHRQTRWTSLLAALFIFSVIFWQKNISWAYWMIVGMILLYFLSIRAMRKRFFEKS
ncbi:MAG: DUF2029 domain-containing protein [Anaerolineales bacterium]|nr:DUF2029 domain-containing protein [Anaerolineales bacterium]